MKCLWCWSWWGATVQVCLGMLELKGIYTVSKNFLVDTCWYLSCSIRHPQAWPWHRCSHLMSKKLTQVLSQSQKDPTGSKKIQPTWSNKNLFKCSAPPGIHGFCMILPWSETETHWADCQQGTRGFNCFLRVGVGLNQVNIRVDALLQTRQHHATTCCNNQRKNMNSPRVVSLKKNAQRKEQVLNLLNLCFLRFLRCALTISRYVAVNLCIRKSSCNWRSAGLGPLSPT